MKFEIDTTEFKYASEYLDGILEAVYKTGDVLELENCLEELAFYFGKNLPKEKPVLEKTKSFEDETDRILKNWIGYSHQYAENMIENTKGGWYE